MKKSVYRWLSVILALIMMVTSSQFVTRLDTAYGAGLVVGTSTTISNAGVKDNTSGIRGIEEVTFELGLYRNGYTYVGPDRKESDVKLTFQKALPNPQDSSLYLITSNMYSRLENGEGVNDPAKGKVTLGWYNAATKEMNANGEAELVSRIKTLSTSPTNPSTTGVYYSTIKSKVTSDNFTEVLGNGKWKTVVGVSNTTGAMNALSWIFQKTGTNPSRWDINNRFNSFLNSAGLDMNNVVAWTPEQMIEHKMRMLDLLMCIYTVYPDNSTYKVNWESAIEDWIAESGLKQKPVTLLVNTIIAVNPGAPTNSTTGVILTRTQEYLNYAAGIEYKYIQNGLFYNDLSDVPAPGASGVTKTYNYITDAVNKSINASPTFKRITDAYDANNGYSHGLGAVAKFRLSTSGGSTSWKNTSVAASYLDVLRIDNVNASGASASGFMLILSAAGSVKPSFSIKLGVEPKSLIVPADQNKINKAIELTLTSTSSADQINTWVPLIEAAKKQGLNAELTLTMENPKHTAVYLPNYIAQKMTYTPAELLTFLQGGSIRFNDTSTVERPINNDEKVGLQYTATLNIKLVGKDATATSNTERVFIKKPKKEVRTGVYTSTPQSWAEIKEGSPYNEKFEAMAGVPTTETLYFGAGGSEFVVDIVVEEVIDTATERTYRSVYGPVDSEFKAGDTAPSKTVGGLSVDPHNGGNYSKNWSGSIPNKAVAVTVTGTGNVTANCPADPDYTAYNTALIEANAYAAAVNGTVISHTAASDKQTRNFSSWGASVSPSTSPPSATSASDSKWYTPPYVPAVMGTDEDGNSYEVSAGYQPADVPMPASATANPGPAGSYSITVSFRNSAHVICGPSCTHVLPEIEDNWKQTVTFDHLKIKEVKVWKIDKASVNGMTEITGTDEVMATVVQGDPNIFYNIAPTQNSVGGRLRYSVEPTQHDAVTWNNGTRTNKDDGLGSNGVASGSRSAPWATGIVYTNTTASTVVNYHTLNSDAKDIRTVEYAKFDDQRKMLNTATVISDYLILQTSSGDQSVIYFHKQSTPKPTQENFEKVTETFDTMWTNNPNSAAKWTSNRINIGSYNGNYSQVSSKYNGNGGDARVNTFLDVDPAGSITRPSRPSNLRLYQSGIEQIVTNQNKSYVTGIAEVFWRIILNVPSSVVSDYSTDVIPKYGSGGYAQEANYSPAHVKVNDIVVHNPVSAQNATVVGLDSDRDQRSTMPAGSATDMNNTLNGYDVCPLDPGLCEFRVLNCTYFQDGGTAEHTEECYAQVTLDPDGFTVHKHTAACLSNPIAQFNYTGNTQSYDVPHTGWYTFKAWGASGGGGTLSTEGSRQGLGGYTEGRVYLTKGEKIYVNVGGAGVKSTGLYNGGGWNGGGHGGANGFGGGGATDFRLNDTAASSLLSVSSRIMVAGGGGGADNLGAVPGGVDDGTGGAGGGLVGGDGLINGAPKAGATYAHAAVVNGGGNGKGGSQTQGYELGQGESATFATDTGGAGGGYYGGLVTNHNNGGAGGGSSYISGLAGVNSVDNQGRNTGSITHYSGKTFTSAKTESGINSGNGKAQIIPDNVENVLDKIAAGGYSNSQMETFLGPELNRLIWGSERVLHTWQNWTANNMKGFTALSGSTIARSGSNLNMTYSGGSWEFTVPVDIAEGSLITEVRVLLDNNTTHTGPGISKNSNYSSYTGSTAAVPQGANRTVVFKPNWTGKVSAINFDLMSMPAGAGTVLIRKIELVGYGKVIAGTGDVQTVTVKKPKETSTTTTTPKYIKVTTTTRYTNGVAGSPSVVESVVAAMGTGSTTDIPISTRTLLAAAGQVWEYSVPNGYTFTVPGTGTYTLEAWGAQGGGDYGGKGGYSKGDKTLTEASKLYVYVGGQGKSTYNTYNLGGFNGGGAGRGDSYAGGGGGATHISTRNATLAYLKPYIGDILIVAGGGGGQGTYSSARAGGVGGGANGGRGSGYAWGGGGTQTAGGGGLYSGSSSYYGYGSFGMGGEAQAGGLDMDAGGGGGGYYGGGGAGIQHDWSEDAGGGGGSGYIGGVTGGSTSAGQQSGDGKVKITSKTDIYRGTEIYDRVVVTYRNDTTSVVTNKTVVEETTKSTFDPLKIDLTVATYEYPTFGSHSFTAPETGKYSFEAWGASGAYTSSATSGKGGYTYGEINLTAGETIQIYVGEKGTGNSNANPNYTFNGGGFAGHPGTPTSTSHDLYGGRGGGATDFRLTGGLWDSIAGLRSRIMVAGGGGGSGCASDLLIHGDAGGLVGSSTLNGQTTYYGYVANGGTQTSGKTGTRNGSAVTGTYTGAGQFGKGAIQVQCAAGGGGGYYGGGGTYTAGGAGGSSFISGYAGANAVNSSGVHTGSPNHYSGKVFSNTSMKAGYDVMPSPSGGTEVGHTGDGYARISFIPSAPVGGHIKQIIVDNFDMIPLKLADGSVNPIWMCRAMPFNGNVPADTKTISVLNCTEPHHYGQHYDVSNDICWDACGNDANHAAYKPTIVTPTGTIVKSATFINLDWAFQIYFPSVGDFYDGGKIGIPSLTTQRGLGYIDNMDTSKWTKSKRVKFGFNVINLADGKLYRADEWIQLDKNNTYYDFYCVLGNSEAKGANVQFEVEAINSPGFNDNKDHETNKIRYSDFSALHGGTANKVVDVVGRIGNLVISDTDDYRFSNLFKVPVSSDNWIVDGLVKEVNSTLQNKYLGDTVDVRGVNAATPTFLNTYGTQPWLQKNPIELPLTSDKNNISALKTQPLRPGYQVLLDITTLGNYRDAMQIVPYYYALDIVKNSIVPVDVYMMSDSQYKPINIYDKVQPGWSSAGIYNYTMNLDWVAEAGRRNYNIELEGAHTNTLASMFEEVIKTLNPTSGEYEITGRRRMDTPSGSYYNMGTAQFMQLNGKARTFIGSQITNGSNKNPDGVLDNYLYWYSGQRWHFKLGLPSSAVFVAAGKSATPAEIEKISNKNTVIIMSMDIKAVGDTFVLGYENPSNNNTITVNGKTITIPSSIPPIAGIYSSERTATQDVDIRGTH